MIEATFDANIETNYQFKKSGNGVYAFVLKGDFIIEGQELSNRDGFGIWETNEIKIISKTGGSEILLMEVPMTLA